MILGSGYDLQSKTNLITKVHIFWNNILVNIFIARINSNLFFNNNLDNLEILIIFEYRRQSQIYQTSKNVQYYNNATQVKKKITAPSTKIWMRMKNILQWQTKFPCHKYVHCTNIWRLYAQIDGQTKDT